VVLSVTSLALLIVATPRPAAAATQQVPAPPTTGPPAPNNPSGANISPELAALPVDGPKLRTAKAAFDETNASVTAVRSARANAEIELSTLAARDLELTQKLASDTTAKKKATTVLASVRENLRGLAVTSYVRGSDLLPDDTDLAAATELDSQQVLFSSVSAGQRDKALGAEASFAAAVAALNRDLAERTGVRTRVIVVTAARDSSRSEESGLLSQLAQRQADLDQARATATVVGTDFSLIALDSYWRAAKETARSKPACGIQWWALAGIAKVEGRHGTYGGAELLANGDTSKPIVGIPLDGTRSTAVISDTDHGQYDGDAVYDRAVGPMQFIPSTWARWKADGNGDGATNPNNMYDATDGAAHYLCAGGPMVSDADLTRGYLSYNHSDAYAANVLGWAQYYRDHLALPSAA
jgi:membrane-bound lytic murein transglycosylase B